MSHLLTLTDANFENEVVRTSSPVVVDFWAEWCGPCRMIAPILDEISKEKGDTVKIGKVNVDENPGLASRYQVRAIPTLLFFKGGEVKEQVVGMTSKHDLVAKIDALS
jgi:thioredoxin 1